MTRLGCRVPPITGVHLGIPQLRVPADSEIGCCRYGPAQHAYAASSQPRVGACSAPALLLSVRPGEHCNRPSDTCRRHDPGALDGSLAAAIGRGARPLTNGAATAAHATEDWHGPGPAAGTAPRPPPARAEADALRITVDDPVKKAEAGLIPGYSSGYVLYRVQTVSKLRGYRGQHASVRRRFRDFVVRGCSRPPYSCAATYMFKAMFNGCASSSTP